jgi:hypothetical protein
MGELDLNIDDSDRLRESVQDDPDFSSWLRQRLSKCVERAEVLHLLACFDQDDSLVETQALRMFKLWLDHPDNFLVDEDLRLEMIAVRNKHSK